MNNASILNAIDKSEQTRSNPSPRPRRRVTSDPILPDRLPSTAFIQREADGIAPRSVLWQLKRSPISSSDSLELPSSPDDPTKSLSAAPSTPPQSTGRSFFKSQPGTKVWKEPQAFEVLRAVEVKDLVFLIEIRDRAFHLLLRKSGDVTPLLHAMRIGQSHREVAIVLLGAFSRWINHLEDDEMRKPQTKTLLKALRANLKLAIDFGLAKSQSDLTASFLQTLIMSEGDQWVKSQVADTAIALRSGASGKPVETADAAVRRFATKELVKADLIAALEDYVANATLDLLLMGAWALASDRIPSATELIPVYYFARDDRVFKTFQDRLDKHKAQLHLLGQRLKWQLDILNTVIEGRAISLRAKVEMLARSLDEST